MKRIGKVSLVLLAAVIVPSRSAAQLANIAPAGAAIQSSLYPCCGGYPAELAIDLDFGNYTATAPADAAPTWQVDLGKSHDVRKIVLHNRGDGLVPERLRDITVLVLAAPGGATAFESDLLNPANALGRPVAIALDLVALTGAGVNGQVVVVTRKPDPLGVGDAAALLSLGEARTGGTSARNPSSPWAPAGLRPPGPWKLR